MNGMINAVGKHHLRANLYMLIRSQYIKNDLTAKFSLVLGTKDKETCSVTDRFNFPHYHWCQDADRTAAHIIIIIIIIIIIVHMRMQPGGYGAAIYIHWAPGPYLIFVSPVSPLVVLRGPPLLSPGFCLHSTPRHISWCPVTQKRGQV